ncbi:MAG: TolC family protein [Pyrinomonadaceae bacterium]|nr:TolC family protein [Phycisphaerales bacterium]
MTSVTAGALIVASGCSNPLIPLPEDRGERVPIERLRTVDRFDLSKYVVPVPPEAQRSEPAEIQKPKSRFEGMESLELSLEKVRAATLENNMDLKVALVDPLIADESLRREEAKFEAVFRPGVRYREDDSPTLNTTSSNQQNSLDFSAGVDIPLRSGGRVSVDFNEGMRETNNPFVTLNSSYTSGLAFSVSQPLLRNAGRRANTHSIRIAANDQQIAESQTKLEIIRQVAAADRSYWRLYAALRELVVRQQQYELADAQLQQANRRVRAGDAAEVEVTRAQAGVAERLEAIIISENNILNQQRELKRIINVPGLEMETPVKLLTETQPSPVPYEFDPVSLADQAVANRMEMLELELRIASDISTIEFEKNQALPLFTLDYVYNIQGLGATFNDSHGSLWRNSFEGWSLGLSGEIPLGNEAAKARVQQAILIRLQRLSTKESRRLAIRQEALTAIDAVEAAWQRILAARQSAIAAARTYEAEKRQNEVGARTSTDVLDAATRLADAQSSEIRALSDYQIALVDLSFATGTMLGAAKINWSPWDPRHTPVPLETPEEQKAREAKEASER